MDITVRVLEQTPLAQRQYKDKKTGEQKTLDCVTLKLTDGIDTFIAEIIGDQAKEFPKLDPERLYRVRCTMAVRGWTSRTTGEAMRATTIYLDQINEL
jgi:hypothetical protein